jgi:hypothetical protein
VRPGGTKHTGKSVLIPQILGRLEARGEPALEYTPQFYTPNEATSS